MSYSEIYSFDKKGFAHFYGEVHNANAGSLAVWKLIEEKYLPSIDDPYWKIITHGDYVSRVFISLCDSKSKAINEVWNLAENDSPLTEDERIVMKTTFDKTLVKKEHLPGVIRAYENFEGVTNLKEQAEILKKALQDPDIIAIGFSISLTDGWTDRGLPDPDDSDERLPYNIFTQNDHQFLGE